MGISENKVIEVCSACGTAACWYGEFMCQDAHNSGTTKKTVAELREDKKENEEYWSDTKMTAIYGTPEPFGRWI
jgi:hypothetical protein